MPVHYAVAPPVAVPPVPLHPSWTWDPMRPAAPPDGPAGPYADAAPFGMGPRSCPAGSLSFVIGREVLQALLRRYRWRLASPDADGDWLTKTTMAPTLVLPGPIGLVMEAAGGGPEGAQAPAESGGGGGN